jgi:hypothetical protein
MFRFTSFVDAGDTVREVRQRHPETEEIFDRYGLRVACFDCSIEQIAIKSGVPVVDLVLELDQAIFRTNHVAA